MDSDDLVVTSSLARWYLDHGVEVTVLSFIEYSAASDVSRTG